MYDITVSERQQQLATQLREYSVERLRPFASESEAKSEFPEALVSTLAAIDWLPGADAFAGGADDPVSFLIAAEELAWSDPALALAWVTGRQVAWLLAACGTELQKAKYLPALASSSLPAASLLLFEGYGRAPSEMQTSARRDGDSWVINGDKIAVVNAATANVSIALARDEAGQLASFIVDQPSTAIAFTGADERKLAMGAAQIATTARITDLRVHADAALNQQGLDIAIGVCRLAQAAVSLGVAQAATRYAADWGLNRTAFGRPLVGFQGVAFPLANLFIEAESVRMSLWDALTRLEIADGGEERTSRAVAQSNHLLRNAAREGVELMGVHGVITEHPQERFYRSAAVLAAIDFDPLLSPLVLSNS